MKGQRPRKKIIVFLVDGYSELEALRPTFSALYDSIDPEYEVFFPPMTEDGDERGGDLTSKYGINPSTIEKCIEKLYFKSFLQKNKLYPKDISEVIHIIDMDGAYIDDDSIRYGINPKGQDKPFYDSDNGLIITTNVERLVERNQHKRENIDYLISLGKIKIGSKSIPYSIYFFSSNLDHVLYDEPNIEEGKEKVARAQGYALRYIDDPEEFIKSIETVPGSLSDMSYSESWDFIRERNSNSIKRHTNICLLFKILKDKT